MRTGSLTVVGFSRPTRRRAAWLFASLVMSLLFARPGVAETWFGTRLEYAIPESPRALAVGHLDSDSYVDCVVGTATGSTESIYIFHNDGQGGFSVSAPLPVTNSWNDLEVGDFNGDGRDDIAFCEDPLKIYYANAAYTYPGPSVPVTWPNSGPFERIVVGDIDADGFDDLVGRLGGSWSVAYVLFGSPSGLVTPPVELRVTLTEDQPQCDPETWPTSIYEILLRDMDGDGDLDIAVSCEYEYGDFCGQAKIGIGYFENFGARIISDDAQWIRNEPGGSNIYWEKFDVSDLTQDSLPDVLYRRSDFSHWMEEQVAPDEWVERAVDGLEYGHPFLCDLNGDGKADLIEQVLHTYEIYSGNGDGEFSSVQSLENRPTYLVIADVGGSPAPEILGYVSATKRLVVFPNVATPTASVGAPVPGQAPELRLAPTVARDGAIEVRFSAAHGERAGPMTASVFDVRGANRATIQLLPVAGGQYRGVLSLDAPWVRSGAYWVVPPAPGAAAQRFTVVR